MPFDGYDKCKLNHRKVRKYDTIVIAIGIDQEGGIELAASIWHVGWVTQFRWQNAMLKEAIPNSYSVQ